MKLAFTLNTEKYELDFPAQETLVTVLRNYFKLCGTKLHCSKGNCGACTVLLNGKPVPSCLIPISTVQDSEIMTIEYFKKTDEYADIQKACEHMEITFCASCMQFVAFIAHDIFSKTNKPTKDFVARHFQGYTNHCADLETVIISIMLAATYRRRRRDEA